MKKLSETLRNLFKKTDEGKPEMSRSQKNMASPSEPVEPMQTLFTEDIVVDLLRQVEDTKEGMYTCGETFALLDEYAELVQSKQDAEALMPLVKAHLDACPECAKEYKVLLRILESDPIDG